MHERIKGSFRYFVITAVCLFLILGCLVLYAGVQEANLKKAEAVRETKIYAERIEALLNSLFHKTDILESIIITSNEMCIRDRITGVLVVNRLAFVVQEEYIASRSQIQAA